MLSCRIIEYGRHEEIHIKYNNAGYVGSCDNAWENLNAEDSP